MKVRNMGASMHAPLNMLLDCVLWQVLFPEKPVCQKPARHLSHSDDWSSGETYMMQATGSQ